VIAKAVAKARGDQAIGQHDKADVSLGDKGDQALELTHRHHARSPAPLVILNEPAHAIAERLGNSDRGCQVRPDFSPRHPGSIRGNAPAQLRHHKASHIQGAGVDGSRRGNIGIGVKMGRHNLAGQGKIMGRAWLG